MKKYKIFEKIVKFSKKYKNFKINIKYQKIYYIMHIAGFTGTTVSHNNKTDDIKLAVLYDIKPAICIM